MLCSYMKRFLCNFPLEWSKTYISSLICLLAECNRARNGEIRIYNVVAFLLSDDSQHLAIHPSFYCPFSSYMFLNDDDENPRGKQQGTHTHPHILTNTTINFNSDSYMYGNVTFCITLTGYSRQQGPLRNNIFQCKCVAVHTLVHQPYYFLF